MKSGIGVYGTCSFWQAHTFFGPVLPESPLALITSLSGGGGGGGGLVHSFLDRAPRTFLRLFPVHNEILQVALIFTQILA